MKNLTISSMLLIFLIISTSNGNAILGNTTQGSLSLEWNITLGSEGLDSFTDIKQTSDGGYIAVGTYRSPAPAYSDFWLVKLDQDGIIEWNKKFDSSFNDIANHVEQAKDGGYILIGENAYDIYVIKTDSFGNKEWEKSYHGAVGGPDRGEIVKQTKDGGYILGGTTVADEWTTDMWITKLDSTGDTTWQKNFDGYDHTDDLYGLEVADDGGYVLVGSKGSWIASEEAWIIKTDAYGDMQWNLSLGGDSYADARAFSIVKVENGNYLISAYKTLPGWNRKLWLIKMGSEGNILWDKVFDLNSAESIRYSIDITYDNNYILAGYKGINSENGDIFIFNTNSNGEVLWNVTYSINPFDSNPSISVTADNGFIVAGSTLIELNWNGFIAKFKQDCIPDWRLQDFWTQCSTYDQQFRTYYDANDCSYQTPEPITRFCDYCVPNWQVFNYTSCQEGWEYASYIFDENNCYTLTNQYSDLYHGNLSEFAIKCNILPPDNSEVPEFTAISAVIAVLGASLLVLTQRKVQ